MFCTKCGNRLAESAALCGSCGAAVAAQAPAQQPAPEAGEQQQPAPDAHGQQPESSAYYAEPAHNAEPAYNAGAEGQSVTHPDGYGAEGDAPQSPGGAKKLTKKAKIAIVAAAACVVLVGGIVIANLGNDSEDPAPVAANAEGYYDNEELGALAAAAAATELPEPVIEEVSEIYEVIDHEEVLGFSGFLDFLGTAAEAETFSVTLSLSADAAPGAVRQLAREFGATDQAMIGLLELLASSSIDVTTFYNLSPGNEVISSLAAWNVRSLNDGSSAEIISLEALIVDYVAFIRVPQLLRNYIGMDLSEIFDISDGGIFDMLFFGTSPNMFESDEFMEFALMMELFADNEAFFEELLTDAFETFMAALPDAEVSRNVSVNVVGRQISVDRNTITIDEYLALSALIEVVYQLANNDDFLRFYADLMNSFDPHMSYTPSLARRDMMYIIEDLEWELDFASRNRDEFEIFWYTDSDGRIVGAGGRDSQFDIFIEAVFAPGVGFHVIFEDPLFDEFFRLYGTMSGTSTVRGEINIEYRSRWMQYSGRIAAFEYDANMFSILVTGRDLVGAFGDMMFLSRDEERFVSNLEFEFLFEVDETSAGMTITARHLDPQISISLHTGVDFDVDVNVSRPTDAQVDFVDMAALMAGADIFEVFERMINPFELMMGAFAIIDSLERMGFDNVADIILGGGGLFATDAGPGPAPAPPAPRR